MDSSAPPSDQPPLPATSGQPGGPEEPAAASDEPSLEQLLDGLAPASAVSHVVETSAPPAAHQTITLLQAGPADPTHTNQIQLVGGQIINLVSGLEVAQNTTVMSVGAEGAPRTSGIAIPVTGVSEEPDEPSQMTSKTEPATGPSAEAAAPEPQYTTMTLSMPAEAGSSAGPAQQILIPIDASQASQITSGNTVLLPVIPHVLPDGRIEMRVATGALQLPAAQPQAEEVAPKAKRKKKAKKDASEQPPKEKAAPKLFTCELCDYSNPKHYLLVRHLKSHSEDRPHGCTVCSAAFKTASSLNNHLNTHTGSKPFPCKQCDMRFTTSGELVRHARYKHTLEKPHACPTCSYATVELSKLKRHIRSHTGERPFKCPSCPYSSPDTYKLKRHMRTHSGEKPYQCHICQARFTQSNSLKAHVLIHDPDTKPVFHCPHCPTTCGRKTDLRIHVLKLHEPLAEPLPCARCDQTFTDRYSLRQHHKAVHEGTSGKAKKRKRRSVEEEEEEEEEEPTTDEEEVEDEEEESEEEEAEEPEEAAAEGKKIKGEAGAKKTKAIGCAHCDVQVGSLAELRKHVRAEHSAGRSPAAAGLTDLSALGPGPSGRRRAALRAPPPVARPPPKRRTGPQRPKTSGPQRPLARRTGLPSTRARQIRRDVSTAFGFGQPQPERSDDEQEEEEM